MRETVTLCTAAPMEHHVFEQIGEHSSKAYFIFDIKLQQLCYLNKAAEQLLQNELQKVQQMPGYLLQLVHPDDQVLLSNLYNKLLQFKPAACEFKLLLPGVSEKTIQLEAYPVAGAENNEQLIAGTAEDVTARVQYVDYLMEFGRKKNSALEILSHDLRGPVAMINSVSFALEVDHQQQDYSEILSYTKFIRKACDTCVNLITEILSEEHLKSPTVAVKKSRVEIVEKVRDIITMFALNKSIERTFEIHAPSAIYAYIDIVKFDQVVNNLISNAIKFTKPDGVISITIEQDEQEVLLQFADNGIGIPQELLPFLFEKYSRAARPGLLGEKPTGLGLSIVKKLIELQGGRVWCESEENIGTTVFITLTAADA